jgi:hypothetical protein
MTMTRTRESVVLCGAVTCETKMTVDGAGSAVLDIAAEIIEIDAQSS